MLATGYYHSRTPVLAADYRARVAAIAEGRIPAMGLGVPLYVRAIQQGTLRIALAGGGVLRINVGRQPSLRPRRRPDACQRGRRAGRLPGAAGPGGLRQPPFGRIDSAGWLRAANSAIVAHRSAEVGWTHAGGLCHDHPACLRQEHALT